MALLFALLLATGSAAGQEVRYLCPDAMAGKFPTSLMEEGTSRIRIEAERIARERNSFRSDHACILAQSLKFDTAWVTDDDIAALTGLMTDRDDGVRLWIAAALGRIGPRAKDAVPALQRAYREIACVRVNATSAGAIAVALGRIGGAVPVVQCSDGLPDYNALAPQR